MANNPESSNLVTHCKSYYRNLVPGLSIAIIVGLAALFLSEHYGAPAMLFALLLGIALSFLHSDERCQKGIEFGAGTLLKFGIALLGLRIALSDLTALGAQSLCIVIGGLITTIILGTLLAKKLGLSRYFGVLTGGSVAICGASAAMAITAILPNYENKERDTLLTVICVTSLSTIAMVLYPVVVNVLELDHIEAGIFLGGTIHDVAQVVGAGYSVSDETGDFATLVKLFRVAMLVPVVLALLFIIRRFAAEAKQSGGMQNKTQVPAFLLWFIALMLINSFVDLPSAAVQFSSDLSRFALVVAIAAIGMKSNLSKLASVGITPIILMVVETLWIAGVVLAATLLR